MNLIELEQSIRQWGVDRNITAEGGATVQAQASKGLEEMAEMFQTLSLIYENQGDYDKLVPLQVKLQDDIGDVTVCMIQAARLAGTDLTECLEQSWNDIKDRKGTMVNGKFVKQISEPREADVKQEYSFFQQRFNKNG